MTVAALSPSPSLAHRPGGLVHDGVLGGPARLEREVVAGELELEPDHVGGEDAERLVEQLLAGVVPLQDDDRPRFHRGGVY